ncbi:MAG TPA: NADH-quinone oxidoreductase subunit A [Acidobacteriota bacterium]|nr:NADH-quinone oxidoreductase subunit A [Acidobacteriota bacterium]
MIELVLTFVVFGGLGAAMLFMNRLLGPRRRLPAKDLPFECGSPYLQKEIPPVPVPFALAALMFLLFDVEVIFFFPWALVLRDVGARGVLAFLAFLAVLVPGFLYAWKKGAFDWER